MRANTSYFTSWSPSRLEKWELCPKAAKLELLDKLCTFCFKGQVYGKWGEPQICNKCGKAKEVGPALVRGDDIGNRLDEYLSSAKRTIPVEIKNEVAIAHVKMVKAALIKGKATIQKWLKLSHEWKPLPDDDWGAWFNGRLDAFVREYGWKTITVIDWKTGGLDRQGRVKPESGTKYKDQLNSYQTGVLSYFPEVQQVKARLVFTDTAVGEDPIVEHEPLTRDDLAKSQKAWQKRLAPYFADRDFSPRANYKCPYCPFSKAKGGPCVF